MAEHSPHDTHDRPDRTDPAAVAAHISDRVWNHARLEVVDTFFAPHFVGHASARPDLHGPEEFKRFARGLRAALPDLRERIELSVHEGDLVFLRSVLTGTHRGELLGVPATGMPVRINRMSIYRFDQDRVVEMWQQIDYLGAFEQLGITPPKDAGPLGQIAHTFALMGRFALLKAKSARKGRTAA
ncbi:ester cyclase [Streptomyces sp. NPDC018031]|uniref:ester cyclase n=1 Tax=Streptomyces sp. NPDC018031 TaxID=3365033 RepID=UPI003793DDD5